MCKGDVLFLFQEIVAEDVETHKEGVVALIQSEGEGLATVGISICV